MFKLKQLDVPTIATILESYSKILGGRNVKFLVPEEILEDWKTMLGIWNIVLDQNLIQSQNLYFKKIIIKT